MEPAARAVRALSANEVKHAAATETGRLRLAQPTAKQSDAVR